MPQHKERKLSVILGCRQNICYLNFVVAIFVVFIIGTEELCRKFEQKMNIVLVNLLTS